MIGSVVEIIDPQREWVVSAGELKFNFGVCSGILRTASRRMLEEFP